MLALANGSSRKVVLYYAGACAPAARLHSPLREGDARSSGFEKVASKESSEVERWGVRWFKWLEPR
jgi:hypothetical protein